MPQIPGFLPRSPLGGIANPYLADDLDQFEAPRWPFSLTSTSLAQVHVLTSNLPVTVAAQQLPGFVVHSFVHDYYNRIHISLDQIELGNVVSTQTSAVQVWNAYFGPRTLSAIAGLDEGIELSGQSTPPLLFSGLQEREWQVGVTPDGAPVLDTALVWQFANGDTAVLRLIANRIIAWAFAPDWGDGVTETLTWATDILQSESGMEQRRSIRLSPRREFEASLLVEGRERQLLDLSLFGWGARVWALPIWPDVQLLTTAVTAGATNIVCTTTGRDFRQGGLAMLRGESSFAVEVVEVLSVEPTALVLKRATQQTWPAGSRLYPVRPAQLVEQPSSSRLTDRVDRLDARFLVLEASDWPAAMPATLYRGWPVLEERPDESEDLTRAYQRLLLELDSGSALPLTTDTGSGAFPVLQHRWLLGGRGQQAAFRELLYALNGRQSALWVPTHAEDLTLAQPVSAASESISVPNIGYTRFAQARVGRRDIRIELVDGTVLHRRITGSTSLNSEVEVLLLDRAIGRQVLQQDVARISWLVLCRLDSDSMTIEHITDADGVARSQAVFRGVRDEEFTP